MKKIYLIATAFLLALTGCKNSSGNNEDSHGGKTSKSQSEGEEFNPMDKENIYPTLDGGIFTRDLVAWEYNEGDEPTITSETRMKKQYTKIASYRYQEVEDNAYDYVIEEYYNLEDTFSSFRIYDENGKWAKQKLQDNDSIRLNQEIFYDYLPIINKFFAQGTYDVSLNGDVYSVHAEGLVEQNNGNLDVDVEVTVSESDVTSIKYHATYESGRHFVKEYTFMDWHNTEVEFPLTADDLYDALAESDKKAGLYESYKYEFTDDNVSYAYDVQSVDGELRIKSTNLKNNVVEYLDVIFGTTTTYYKYAKDGGTWKRTKITNTLNTSFEKWTPITQRGVQSLHSYTSISVERQILVEFSISDSEIYFQEKKGSDSSISGYYESSVHFSLNERKVIISGSSIASINVNSLVTSTYSFSYSQLNEVTVTLPNV